MSPGIARPICLYQLDYLLSVRLLAWPIIDCDICAFPRVSNGGRPAHARVAARDESLTTGQSPGSFIASFSVVGSRHHLTCQPRPRLRLPFERRSRIFAPRIFHHLLRHICASLRQHWRAQSRHAYQTSSGAAHQKSPGQGAFAVGHLHLLTDAGADATPLSPYIFFRLH